ncbi:MAG: hypothetical protein ABII82_16050 [Verrucomicrobiota bacterium]
MGGDEILRILKTFPPFPPGTLVGPTADGGSPLPANEAMRHFLKLRHRLNVLQHRLGTPLETCADLDEARTITHALWNYVQIRWLWTYLGAGQLPGSPSGADPVGNDVV